MDCFPYFVQGKVISGYGRGSKDLGIPTANFSNDIVEQLPKELESGVYYGWASVDGVCGVHQMVSSIGWNVFYGNKVKTLETHIMKQFDEDFYGENLRIVVLGFIRPMLNFDSLDALITAIHNDIRIAEEQLTKPENLVFKGSPFFVRDSPHGTSEDKSATPGMDGTCSRCQVENGCVRSAESHNSPNNCSSNENSSDVISKEGPVNETIAEIYHMKGREATLGNSIDKGAVLLNDKKHSKLEKLKSNLEIQSCPVNGHTHSSKNGKDICGNPL